MLDLNKRTKTKPKPTLIFKNTAYMCAYHCAQLSYTTVQNGYDYLPSYPTHSLHCSDAVWDGQRQNAVTLSCSAQLCYADVPA